MRYAAAMRTIGLTLLLCAVAAAQATGPSKQRGFFGAEFRPGEGGVLLHRVVPNSPAANAGLKPGDILTRIGDTPIDALPALGKILRASTEGTKLKLQIRRSTATVKVTITLGIHPRILLEQPDTSEGMLPVVIQRDLPYGLGDAKPHERHKLNLFVPKIDTNLPIMLWIHAGAWSFGDRKNETALAMRFAERGIGFAPMSYRLSSKVWSDPKASKEGVLHPAHAEDCAMAFAWLRKRFPKNPLFVGGHSCGAHLAVLMAMDPRYLRKHGLELSEIKGAFAPGGAYDLVKYHDLLTNGLNGEPGMGKERADAHLRWIFGENKEQWIAASPVTYLAGCKMPMLIVAEKGAAMTRYTKDFDVAVKAANVSSIRFLYLRDRGHGETTQMMARKSPDPLRAAVIEFMRANGTTR